MVLKQVSINDFEIYYDHDFENIDITCSAYYLSNNNYFNIESKFNIIGYAYTVIIDKLNFKRDYINIFKNVVLTKLISTINNIQPIKIDKIPEGAKIYKLHPYISFNIKENGWEKYHQLINPNYLKEQDINWKDRDKIDDLALDIFLRDLDHGMCQLTLADIEYKMCFDKNNQWYSCDSDKNNFPDLSLSFDDLGI
jgi:hypothetical protein